MSVRIACIVALLLLLPCATWAEDEEESRHTGTYLGLNAIFAGGLADGERSVAPHTGGFGFVVTQRFDYLAAEIYGNWLYGGGSDVEGMQVSFGLRGKVYLPLGPVDPYVVLGIGPLTQKTDKWRWGGEWQGGVGVEYFFDEKWALTGEVVYRGGTGYFKGLEYVNTSIGARMHF